MPELYAYQRHGMLWLAERRRAYLADDMGLGKTPQAIRAAAYLGVESVMVVCPASVRDVWRAEIGKWDSLNPPCRWDVWGYEELVNHVSHGHPVRGAELLIVDEAQYCKNLSAKRSKVVLKLANQAPRIWFLSGTPMPNHPGELYTVFRAVWPDLMPANAKRYGGWLDTFCQYDFGQYNNIRVFGARNTALLRDLLDRIMLRRKLDDVDVDLPDLRFEEMMLPVAPSALELLSAAEAETETDAVLAAVTAGQVPASTSRLRHILGVEKARVLASVLREELEASPPERKLVVLAHHREALRLLTEGLAAFGAVTMDGSTPAAQRAMRIRRFQQEPDCRVFVGQLTTAGVGITLHAASEIVLAEPPWSPGDIQQAVKRIHRIGQDKPCRARMCFVPQTLDEGIQRVISRKLQMENEIVHSYGARPCQF